MAANAAPGEGCASSWRRPVVPAPAGVTLAEGNAPRVLLLTCSPTYHLPPSLHWVRVGWGAQ